MKRQKREETLALALIRKHDKPTRRHWFVCQTWDDMEVHVEATLNGKGVEAWCPKVKAESSKSRGRTLARDEAAVFPGYIFVHMAPDALPALEQFGILGFDEVLGTEYGPTRMRDEEMAEVRAMAEDWTAANVKSAVLPEFKAGQSVLVQYGAYGTIAGRIREIFTRKSMASVILNFFGGEIVAHAPLAKIRPMDQSLRGLSTDSLRSAMWAKRRLTHRL